MNPETNFMVITKSETLPSDFESKLAAYGEIVNTIPEIGIVVVKPTVANFKSKVSKLQQVLAVVHDFEINWIDPLKVFPAENPPSIGDDEPYFWIQWGMDAIDAPEAWNEEYTGSNTRVCILDTGIDSEHPDLDENLNIGLSTSFVPNEDYIDDEHGHGTHVAGIIAAEDNSSGVIGVAPDAEIVAVKVLNKKGSGAFSWINEGIVYAADIEADVINMSLGGTLNRNGYYIEEGILVKYPPDENLFLMLAQQRAVNYAFRNGVTIISTAGNEAQNYDGNGSWIKLPAELQNVIVTSATAPYNWYVNPDGSLDLPASYTNYGRSLVDIAAPGGDYLLYPNGAWMYDMVLSTYPGSYAFIAGTSMASPHVAGVAALIIGKNGGEMDPHEVTKQLLKTADKIDGQGISPYFGFGRVNAYRAVTE
ncbi:MAG: S8 family serine peptidase [Bacteroidales bacterium]|nr:S8 family serine peptidase [Bacteroidales bacterium]